MKAVDATEIPSAGEFDREILAQLRHKPGCPGDQLSRWRGRRGDHMATCRTCGVVTRLHEGPASDDQHVAFDIRQMASESDPAEVDGDLPGKALTVDEESASASPAAGVVWFGYRCSEHLDRSVNWRGVGCPDCAEDRRERERRKQTARRVRAQIREARAEARKLRR